MGISAVICFLFPIIIFVFFKRKEKISFKPVLIGMLIFFVFTQILEKLLHLFVIGTNLIPNPIAFSIYGALAAGIFEEGGRYFAFKTLLKDRREWKDGMAYGIGHAGIEAILVGVLMNVQFIVYSNLINKGIFDTELGSKIPASQLGQLQQLKEMLIQAPASNFAIGIFERIFAFGVQMALTMVVLYAIRYRKNIYIFIAILLHALMDFPAALYQMKITSMYVPEGFIFICFVVAIIFLFRTKKIFDKEAV
jgi:uncharacterized membrane protein YhfC